MSNLKLYRLVCNLKNYLELHELDEVSSKRIEKSVGLVNEIFQTLERRGAKRAN